MSRFLICITVGAAERPSVQRLATGQPCFAIKGTAEILAALDRQRDRISFDVEVVTGPSHKAAMASYRRADLAVDQIHPVLYRGFAVELMAMGSGQEMAFVPSVMEAALPVYRVAPDNLEADLNSILADSASWCGRGLLSRRVVEAWRDSLRIAAQLAAVLGARGLPTMACTAGQGADRW